MKKPLTAAQALCRIGARAAQRLSRAVTPLTEGGGGLHDVDGRRLSLLIHGHALVWYGVSRSLPIEMAMPLLEAHARCAHEEFRAQGLDWTLEETTDAITAVWHAYIEAGSGEDKPQWAIVSTILRNHLASPAQGMSAADELTRHIDILLIAVRTVVLSVEPGAESANAVDFLEFLANKPDHGPMDHQEDVLPAVYPLRLGDVARLDPRACAEHLTRLKSYPPSQRVDEHRRRRILRAELRRRLRRQGLARQAAPARIIGRVADPSPLRRWLRFGRNANGIAWIGFLLGLASVAFWFVVAIPLAAIVCGGVGLAQSRQRRGRGGVPAAVGLGAGLVFFVFHVVVRVAVLLRG